MKPGAKGQKKGGPKLSKVVESKLLYSFSRGVLTTCDVPAMKIHSHPMRFNNQRCGFSNGKFYFLSDQHGFGYREEVLQKKAELKVYNPVSKVVETVSSVCACNRKGDMPLFIRATEMLDLSCNPHTISLTNGSGKLVNTLELLSEYGRYTAGFALNQELLIVAKESDKYEHEDEYVEMERPEVVEDKSELYLIKWIGFKCSKLPIEIRPGLDNASIVTIAPNEYLILGQEGGSGMVSYRCNTATGALTKEGGTRMSLGKCISSAVSGGDLYMFFPSGCCVKCSLKTGLMKTFYLRAFESMKCILWLVSKGPYSRLPRLLLQDIFGYLFLSPD